MSSIIRPEDEPQIQPRNPFARPGPIPDIRLAGLYVERAPSLVARADSSSTDNSHSGGSSNTVPIVVGVVVPLGIALIVLIFLHRRHVKKLRREDAEDKHKALDFGLDEAQQKPGKKTRRKAPEMSMAETKEVGRRGRGLSLDLGPHNPYLLPPEVHQSRESLHSLSRSMNTGDDKYRTTTFIPDDGSIRPPSSLRSHFDDSSSYTGSSGGRFPLDSKQNLLRNAQENPRGPPSRHVSTSSVRTGADPIYSGNRTLAQASNNNLLAPVSTDPVRESYLSTASSNGAINALRASNNYLAQFISGGKKAEPEKKEPVAMVTEIRVEPPAEDLQVPPPAVVKDAAVAAHVISTNVDKSAPSITLNVQDTRQPRLPQLSLIDSEGNKQHSVQPSEVVETVSVTSHSTPQHSNTPSTDLAHPAETSQTQFVKSNEQDSADNVDYYDEYEAYASQDHPESEYEDYQYYQNYVDHDERRLTMGVRPLPPDDPSDNPEQRANRIRSFYKEYFDETKPQPSAQNSRYHDGAENYYGPHGVQGHHHQGGFYAPPRKPFSGRHRAMSNGSFMPGPRAFSSASSRYTGHHPHLTPKKKLPPPKPLNILPTPHLLDGDSFLPIDFAPPQRFQKQRAGTPDSPRGGVRPYSPVTPAHLALASSFDDLAVIPSPHALRKSATFTALDFAPPRLRGVDTMSETGSIRSNGSGMSAVHLHSIRAGAYRVSRIPKEVAGTKDELAEALKPQWGLNRV
ncbi:hypothetical protein A1O1_08188 [Capronia coronata CBS 617.96]|uniref:Uncharacterized protein n=1 Tax=Capronia coronata CBS 617.96 TaxID=1182541 RepID=W9YIJ1_9EURO|nr:uncharacterized protein A1O1_08188 [Capronia coronata CBS 617.96]EXJ82119.1 hypothetical protein A1O1_08188 [Capronia coronata CBS 617.96]